MKMYLIQICNSHAKNSYFDVQGCIFCDSNAHFWQNVMEVFMCKCFFQISHQRNTTLNFNNKYGVVKYMKLRIYKKYSIMNSNKEFEQDSLKVSTGRERLI